MTLALAVTLAVATEPASALAPFAVAVKPVKVESRPDVVSARMSARSQGSRVEVESLRDETSSTWVNPDGTFTTDQHGGPIRFRDTGRKDAANPKGVWRDVDLSMAEFPDGTVGPRGHVLGLSLAGASKGAGGSSKGTSETDIAVTGHGLGKAKQDRAVTLGWGGSLGKPVLAGTTATYKDVKPGVDLLVDARRNGYETHLVINTAQALAALKASATGGVVSWDIPVKTKGLTARPEKDGSVSFVDADGQVTSKIPAPIAWDAVMDERSGNRTNESPMSMTVAQRGKGQAVLTVTPDQAWLTDPARVFPLTLDPTYAATTSVTAGDAYVSSAFPSQEYYTATELRVGTYNGGGDKYRSFLKFNFAPFKGLQIVSANVSLYEFDSWSCTAKPVEVWSTSAVADLTALNWGNQPTVQNLKGSLPTANGFSSACAAKRIYIPATALVQGWSTSAYSSGWVQLRASETDNYGYKKFHSVEHSGDPYISFSYNRKPNAASAPVVANASKTPPLAAAATYAAPGTSPASTYVKVARPTFGSTATDPDSSGYSITTEVHTSTAGTSKVTECSSGRTLSPYTYTASGTQAQCTLTTNLADNTTYYARTAVVDDLGLGNGAWSPWSTFKTALTVPAAPVVSCPTPYDLGSWATSPPATTVTCTVTGTGTGTNAPAWLVVTNDTGASTRTAITQSTNPAIAKITVPVSNASGAHSITAKSEGPSGLTSTLTTYGFGYGTAALTAPSASSRVSATGPITVTASGPPRGGATAVSASLRWRTSGTPDNDPDTTWNTSTVALSKTKDDTTGVTFGGSWNPLSETTDAKLDSNLDTPGVVDPTTLNPRVPVLLDVQVCLTYTGTGTQCTWTAPTSRSSVMRLPHAFGDGYPTSGAGPGQVALFTGEFNADATDVQVPGYTGSLSLSRSHSTYGNNPAAAVPAVQAVFGPGWTGSLQGSDEGLAGLGVVDSTAIDGTIDFIDDDGSAMVFAKTPTPARRVASDIATGTYIALDPDTAESGIGLTVTGSGLGTTLSLKEDNGTVTTFTAAQLAPATGKAAVFTPQGVTVPGIGSTTYDYDLGGKVTRILAPLPGGLDPITTCPDDLASTSPAVTAGNSLACRALRLVYPSPTAKGGEGLPGQVTQVNLEIYNPDATLAVKSCTGAPSTPGVGVISIPVACYSYDTTSRRLTSVTDPRNALATSYGYGTTNELTTVTPAGRATYTMVYATLENRLKLISVTRPTPGGGTTNLTRVVYDAPRSGTALPDLSSTSVKRWDQTAAPTYAAAVFGPEYPSAVTQNGPDASADWNYADFSYTDTAGYTINTASFGASRWLYTRTDYDARGNTTFTLDGAATNALIDAGDDSVATAYGTTTIYNPSDTGTTPPTGQPANTTAGSVVTDVYQPARTAVLPNGSTALVRPHTRTQYDAGAPTGGIDAGTGLGYAMPTMVTTTADPSGSNGPGDAMGPLTSGTITGYADPAGANSTGPTSGWTLRTATSTTTDMDLSGTVNAGDITRRNVFDSEGKTIQSRQPSGTGTDAGTTISSYYTIGTNPDTPCGNKPQWAGLACRTSKAAQPAGATLPDSQVTGYNYQLSPTTVDETSGTVTRTSTTTYLLDGRVNSTALTVTGIGSPATARPTVTQVYESASGQATGATDSESSTTSVLDSWGRTTSYTTAQGDTTTTTYDAAGRVSTITDSKGVTTYTYDGTVIGGGTERRGLATQLVVTRGASAGNLTFKAVYDTSGDLVRQDLPGKITQTIGTDEVGQTTQLTYSGQITPVTESQDTNGQTVYTPGTPYTGAWFAWSHDRDTNGRIVADHTGPGAGFDGVPGVTDLSNVQAPSIADAKSSDRSYTYDQAGRLTQVNDATADTTGEDVVTPCTVRTYRFDDNGNRTQLASAKHADGNCAGTADSTDTTGYVYDAADRPTTAGTLNGTTGGAYVYDKLGRQTTLPVADAPTKTGTDITLGYYDNDKPQAVTQNGTTTTYDVDLADRRTTATTTGPTTQTLVRHYSDTSDNPSWTQLGTATTRYVEDLTGNLGATITDDGSSVIPVTTAHGDTVTTIPIAAGQAETTAATSCDGWADYTEYGTPRAGSVTTDAAKTGYGWLGGKQRSTTNESAGLTLMGDRFYNATRGAFTSLDPVPGGNETAFNYPNDPVNKFDLTGQSSCSSCGGGGGSPSHPPKKKARACGLTCKVLENAAEQLLGYGCRFAGLAGVACAALGGALVAAVVYVYRFKGRQGYSAGGLAKAAAWGALKTALPKGALNAIGNGTRRVMIKLGMDKRLANQLAMDFGAAYRGIHR